MEQRAPIQIRSGEGSTGKLAAHGWKFLPLLREPGVVDVVVNPDGQIWANTAGRGFAQRGRMDESEVRRFLATVATIRELDLNHENPILETDLPGYGSRIEGLVSPIVEGAALAIRPLAEEAIAEEEYVASGIFTHKEDLQNQRKRKDRFLEEIRGKDHMEILQLAIRHRRNVVVAGSTGSGKTTLSKTALHLIARLTPKDRVVVLEDTRELRCPLPNHVSLLATRQISLAQCLEVTLRLAPDRIVVGEVRNDNARALLNAWNTGHPGGIATVHADDARNTLRRFEQLLNSATPETKETIAQAVNLVLFLDKDHDHPAGRKLREVLLVHGYDRAKHEYEAEYI